MILSENIQQTSSTTLLGRIRKLPRCDYWEHASKSLLKRYCALHLHLWQQPSPMLDFSYLSNYRTIITFYLELINYNYIIRILFISYHKISKNCKVAMTMISVYLRSISLTFSTRRKYFFINSSKFGYWK